MIWWKIFHRMFWLSRAHDEWIHFVASHFSPTEWGRFNYLPRAANDNIRDYDGRFC